MKKWLKVLLPCVLAGALLISGSKTSFAKDPKVSVLIDGIPLQSEAQAELVNGRTMVPMRSIFETLKAEIIWDQSKHEVTAKKGDIQVLLTIGNKELNLNGKTITLDVPPQLINNNTYVPLRFISESLGADVAWNPNTMTVSITTSPQSNTTPTLYINGKAIEKTEGKPIYQNEALFLPVEPVVTGMGDRFVWQTKPITAVIKQIDGTQIMLSANSSLVRVDGEDVPVSTELINTTKNPASAKPSIINGVLYYPADFFKTVLKYPVDLKKSGSKEYVFFGSVPNELPQELTSTPTPTATPAPKSPAQDGVVYGKLDMSYLVPEGWKPPLIQSIATNDANKNFEILKEELGLTNGSLYNPYGIDASKGSAKIIITSGGDSYLATINFLAWYGSKDAVHVSNTIPYIAREIFKFYLPNDYNVLFDIVTKGVNGGDISKYTKTPFTLDGRTIKIIDKDSGFSIMLGTK